MYLKGLNVTINCYIIQFWDNLDYVPRKTQPTNIKSDLHFFLLNNTMAPVTR